MSLLTSLELFPVVIDDDDDDDEEEEEEEEEVKHAMDIYPMHFSVYLMHFDIKKVICRYL